MSTDLRLVGLVDLHWRDDRPLRLPPIEEGDLVLLGGDLTHFQGSATAERILDAIEERGARSLAVAGNCDLPEVEELFDGRDLGLDRRARVVDGICFLGLSAGLPFGGCPYERTEDDFAEAAASLETANAEVDASLPRILVSHQPPADTACDLTGGRHVGSRAVRAAIERIQPALTLCGHIHESVGEDHLGATRVVNPGPAFADRWLEWILPEGRLSGEPTSHGPDTRPS